MAYVEPKDDWSPSDVLTSAEVNRQAANDIWIASLLKNGVALSAFANGAELDYDMDTDYVQQFTQFTHNIAMASTWEVITSHTALSVVAASTRPILVFGICQAKTSAGTCYLRLNKVTGTGGTDRVVRFDFANTAYLNTTNTLFFLLESPVKGNTYTINYEVYGSGVTPTVSLQRSTLFAVSL